MSTDSTGVLSLPDNALLGVLSVLDVHGVCAVSQVCSRLQLLAAQPCLWRGFQADGCVAWAVRQVLASVTKLPPQVFNVQLEFAKSQRFPISVPLHSTRRYLGVLDVEGLADTVSQQIQERINRLSQHLLQWTPLGAPFPAAAVVAVCRSDRGRVRMGLRPAAVVHILLQQACVRIQQRPLPHQRPTRGAASCGADTAAVCTQPAAAANTPAAPTQQDGTAGAAEAAAVAALADAAAEQAEPSREWGDAARNPRADKEEQGAPTWVQGLQGMDLLRQQEQVMRQRLQQLQAQLLRRPVSPAKPPGSGADAIAGTKKHKAHAVAESSGPAHMWHLLQGCGAAAPVGPLPLHLAYSVCVSTACAAAAAPGGEAGSGMKTYSSLRDLMDQVAGVVGALEQLHHLMEEVAAAVQALGPPGRQAPVEGPVSLQADRSSSPQPGDSLGQQQAGDMLAPQLAVVCRGLPYLHTAAGAAEVRLACEALQLQGATLQACARQQHSHAAWVQASRLAAAVREYLVLQRGVGGLSLLPGGSRSRADDHQNLVQLMAAALSSAAVGHSIMSRSHDGSRGSPPGEPLRGQLPTVVEQGVPAGALEYAMLSLVLLQLQDCLYLLGCNSAS